MILFCSMDRRNITGRMMQVMGNSSSISINKITKIQEAQEDILLPLHQQAQGKEGKTHQLVNMLNHKITLQGRQSQRQQDFRIKHNQALSIMDRDKQLQI